MTEKGNGSRDGIASGVSEREMLENETFSHNPNARKPRQNTPLRSKTASAEPIQYRGTDGSTCSDH